MEPVFLEPLVPPRISITPDTQNLPDKRNIALPEVGISGVLCPLEIGGWERSPSAIQKVTADVSLSVNLAASRKGIHMSRLVENISKWKKAFDCHSLESFLKEVCQKQESQSARIKISFTYFLEKTSPLSGKTAPQGYLSVYEASLSTSGFTFEPSVEVPVMTLCPCSKEISDYGAHSQRAIVRVRTRPLLDRANTSLFPTVQEMVDYIEASASSPVYPLLKRDDERLVTMRAYDHPVFVEDLIRNVVRALQKDQRISCFQAEVINQESIHAHDAFARFESSVES